MLAGDGIAIVQEVHFSTVYPKESILQYREDGDVKLCLFVVIQ